MIKVKNLYYDYPETRALNNINFELQQGSITALVGPNGAGKTTLLRSIADLDEPIQGDIYIGDLNVWESPDKARHAISYLPDHFGLYEHLSLLQNLTYAGWAHGLKDRNLTNAIEWVLQKVKLDMNINTPAKNLSRGQKQRLALAQILIHRPQIVLLDEPASGLDPQSRNSLSHFIQELAKEGMTFIVSSHILNELEDYCSGILILEKGKILSHQNYEAKTQNDITSAIPRTIEIALVNPADNESLLKHLQSQLITAAIKNNMIECTVTADNLSIYNLHKSLMEHWQIIHFALKVESLQSTYLNILGQYQQNAQATKEQSL